MTNHFENGGFKQIQQQSCPGSDSEDNTLDVFVFASSFDEMVNNVVEAYLQKNRAWTKNLCKQLKNELSKARRFYKPRVDFAALETNASILFSQYASPDIVADYVNTTYLSILGFTQQLGNAKTTQQKADARRGIYNNICRLEILLGRLG